MFPWEVHWDYARVRYYPEQYSSVTVLGNDSIDGTYDVSYKLDIWTSGQSYLGGPRHYEWRR